MTANKLRSWACPGQTDNLATFKLLAAAAQICGGHHEQKHLHSVSKDMRSTWWIVVVTGVVLVVATIAFVAFRLIRRRIRLNQFSDGSLTCQWAKADALRDSHFDESLGTKLANDLEKRHGLDYPIAIRTSQTPHNQHTQEALSQMRQLYSQGYLKHHQNNVIAQHQFAAAQHAMQHHVDRVRQQSFVGKPYTG